MAVVVVVGSTAVAGAVEAHISEDFLDVHLPAGSPDIAQCPTDCPHVVHLPADFPAAEDLVVDLLVAAEELVVADLPNMRRSAARGAIAEEGIQVATAEDPVEVGCPDTPTEATIILEGITEATIGTIIEVMPRMEQLLGFSLVG